MHNEVEERQEIERVLIEPLWNWNGISLSKTSLSIGS